MNKLKINFEKRRLLNTLKYGSLSGSKENMFRIFGNESERHIDKKWKTWLLLRKNGWSCWCEAVFLDLIRPDILAFKEGRWAIAEILESENEKQLAEKVKNYPPDVEIIKIKDYGDIVISNFE